MKKWHEDRLGKSRYRAVRDSDPDGEATAGLMWARNQLTHGLASVGEIVGHGEGGWGTAGWEWRRVDRLKKVPGDHGRRDMYAEHLAGRPLLEPLDAVVRFLTTTIVAVDSR